jgi:dihydroneopterin triphosphate diphosphatase
MPQVASRAVAVAVLRGRGESTQVLLLLRVKGPFAGCWSLVTGRIEPGESAVQAAIREVAEEAGLTRLTLHTADYCDVFYDPAADIVQIMPIFVAKVAQDATPRINAENGDYRWISVLEAADLVPFVGHGSALRQIHRHFVERDSQPWMLIRTLEASDVQ